MILALGTNDKAGKAISRASGHHVSHRNFALSLPVKSAQEFPSNVGQGRGGWKAEGAYE